MDTTRGRCTNFDYCSLAASRQNVDVRIGLDFVCPECGKPLLAPSAREGSGGRLPLFLALGAFLVLLAGGGVVAGYMLSSRPQAAGSAVPSGGMAMAPHPASPFPQPALSAAVQAPPAPTSPSPVPPAPVSTNAAPPAPLPAALGAGAGDTVLFRLAGAPLLGNALIPRLAQAYLSRSGDTDVTSRQGAGATRVTGQRLSHPETITVTLEPDSAALDALASGTADIAMLARRLSPLEAARLHALGDLTAPASEHPIALDGEAVIVNPARRVSQISLVQLRGVLDGTIATWEALGSTGGNVHVLRAPGSAGLADLVPGAPDVATTGRSVANVTDAVFQDVNALAVVPIAQIGQSKALGVAALGGEPAQPTPAAIAGGTYPLARRLYLYTAATVRNPLAQRFLTFALSPDGQAAVAEAGFVPLVVAAQAPAAPAAPLTPKERYKQLVAGAVRLAADLHFEPRSNVLDLRSSREVDRVWNVMQSDHTPPDHLILIGFADNQGAPEANQALALARAQAVAEVFKRRGLPPGQVISFGADLPVADNATFDGRERNRRVEVFLRP